LATLDPAYNGIEARLKSEPSISVPTLVLDGSGGPWNDPSTSEGKGEFFTGPYERNVVNGAVHFPQRESPDDVLAALNLFSSARY
jgi:pimeloyl-ACP methyl ester carboxylesterase